MKNIIVSLRTGNLVGAILTLIFTVFAAYVTTTWIPPVLPGDPGAAFFPRIALAIMFVFGVILLLQSLRGSRAESLSDEVEEPGVSLEVSGLTLTILYSSLLVIGIWLASFEISAFAFLAYMLGLRTGRWPWAIATSIVAVLAMYALFVLVLQVRLPLLFLPWYIQF